MAKRLNKMRRLKAKLKSWDLQARDLTVRYNTERKDELIAANYSAIRSEQSRFNNRSGASTPPRGWNTDPDVEDGHGKTKRATPERWGAR